MEAQNIQNSFAQREFYRLNAFTATLPKTAEEVARLHPTASTPENYASKNRYGDVLPLEEKRVRLRFDGAEMGRDLGDYINASHVGFGRLQFICAQAPLPSTFVDFWQMVWEQNSPMICSLNREFEKGVPKGDVYWPVSTSSPVDLGHFRITLDAVLALEDHDLVIRYLTLNNKARKETRKVVQLHYLGWPDKGVPKTTAALRELLALHSYYRDRLSTSNSSSSDSSPTIENSISHSDSLYGPLDGPTITHCSAGVGRTGVFVTLALLLESGAFRDAVHDTDFVSDFVHQLPSADDQEASLSIPGYFIPRAQARENWQERLARFGVMDVVKMLREQRNAGMVQTVDQYTLIYSVLRDAIVDEAQQASRSAFHFTNSVTLKKVAEFEEWKSHQRPPSPSDTRSDADQQSSSGLKRTPSSKSSPFPRRAEFRGVAQVAKKRQIDWESEEASESSISSSADMVIDDAPRSESGHLSRRKKVARTIRESPGQEETLLHFS